ncbi:hypothetical protein [Deinococcus hopiensis]|uniref:Uncharacterized protein n=1 Tax=Deinococcus hopiensis KR-140 TaxID=695939 RepID=A0A1W1UKR9_9DEIO|nr:hypothetical protein [Deinococcus hopiensis]SMB81391.1 hypothetical protein SAMN00790413_04562 [Deinococcus hopiensis KR-140]
MAADAHGRAGAAQRSLVSLIDAALVGIVVACVLGKMGFYTSSRTPPWAYYGEFTVRWKQTFVGIFTQYLVMCLLRVHLNKARSTISPISVTVHGVLTAVASGFWAALLPAVGDVVSGTRPVDPLDFLVGPLFGCFISLVACATSLMFVVTGFLYGRTRAAEAVALILGR